MIEMANIAINRKKLISGFLPLKRKEERKGIYADNIAQNRRATMAREKKRGLLIGIYLMSAALIVTGCASGPMGLVKTGELFIEPIPSSRVYFSNLTVRQEGTELVIAGSVSRRNSAFFGSGHVDVAVVAPTGEVLWKASVIYTPRKLRKTPGARKHRGSRFEARLPCVPPQKTTIRIAYHASAYSTDEPDCERNKSVP